MRVIDIALKDITEVLRDRKSSLFLVLMPILFTLFFGFAFARSDPDPRLPVGIIDLDRGALSATLVQQLGASDAVRVNVLQEADLPKADGMVKDGKLAAVIIVPAEFTERTLRAPGAGDPLPLTLIAPDSPAGQAAGTAIGSAVKQLLGSVETAHLAVQTAEKQQPFVGEAARRQFLAASLASAQAEWQDPDVSVAVQVAGVPSTVEKIASGFAQSSPGMLVMFAVFGLITSAMVLAVERKAGTLQRMLTTPLGRGRIIAGHLLAMFALAFVQEAMLVLLGQFAFGVNYLSAPFATLLMMIVLAFWAASLGLLIGAAVRREEHVIAYCLVAMFVFSALGGAWFPLAIAGKAFSTIGHVLPTAWALDGFQNIILRGQGLEAVLLPAAIVAAYGVLFYALAQWRFRFE